MKNVIRPKTYGLICLASPEMQLACAQAAKVLDASGAKLVEKLDVSLAEFGTSAPVLAMRGETSMAAPVLAMSAAAPEHVLHFVVNPSTMVKFMAAAEKQGYYPPKGISGNHLATEALGSLFGKWPQRRYWRISPYRLWGREFMATMIKYARGNRGLNHQFVQAGYVGIRLFGSAAKEVGPNLTREALVATLGNGTVWKADASLDQRFQYVAGERRGNNWNRRYGQGRAFVYRYDGRDTLADPDGSPHGWTPDPDQFVVTASG